MFNSYPLMYCNYVSVPVLHHPSVYSPWNCSVPIPPHGYRTSLDEKATHGAVANERRENTSEPSASRELKFGIENILYGTSSQSVQSGAMFLASSFLSVCGSNPTTLGIIKGGTAVKEPVYNQFPCNKDLSFITYQPFPPRKRTSSRPWCRPVFTQLQRRELEKRFQASNYVSKRERYHFGAMLGLSETQVKVWFQNRRTKCRHEAAKKEEKQNKKQAFKKTNSSNQRQELKIQSDKKEGNE